jgi:hypothetical protein
MEPRGGDGNDQQDRSDESDHRKNSKVSNELSDYAAQTGNRAWTLSGRFRAQGIGIDNDLACFTPRQSETYAWFLRIASRTLL